MTTPASEHSTSRFSPSDYQNYDALGLAALVRAGDASPEELLHCAIQRAEEVNPAINAIITPLYDYARQQLQQTQPDGPFRGVPFLLKDLLAALEGTPMSSGSAALKGVISPADSELVRRFKQAGLVIFGKTNTPELGLMGVTEPKAFGACRNPWNTGHTPGGSSGGSAAAVAAGILPMASAGDGGGSIRIPAACCGLFGLKPSRGLVPTGPYASEYWDGAATEHVITRSVRDSAAMLDVVAGADGSTPYPVNIPGGYLQSLQQAPRKLRIGYTCRSFIGREVTADAEKAVSHSVDLLTRLGHDVEPVTLEFDGEALADSYLTMYFGQVAADLDFMAAQLSGRVSNLDTEDATKVLAYLGKTISAGDYVNARRRWNQFARSMHMFHQKYDLLLTPVLASEPVPIGYFDPSPAEAVAMKIINGLGLHKLLLKTGQVKKMALDNLEKLPFTQLANMTGQPAMSVPLYWTENGLPAGTQFIAPLGQDALLLQLAAQLEEIQPWFDRRPPL